MSTEEILALLCRNGALKQFTPTLSGNETTYRRIYLHPDVYDWLHPPASSERSMLEYAIFAKRYLKGFVIGEIFDDAEKLKNLDTDDFNKTDEGVWALRLKRNPQVRILGGFAAKNIFIGIRRHNRGDLPEGEWVDEKGEIKTYWSGRLKVVQTATAGAVTAHQLARLIGPSREALTDNVRSRR